MPNEDKDSILTEEDIKEMLSKAIRTKSYLNNDYLTKEDLNTKKEGNKRSEEIKRRPCEGCTCSRQNEVNAIIKVEKSKCGSCYLGDAFRCSGCPYLGKPSFEPGKEIFFDSEELE